MWGLLFHRDVVEGNGLVVIWVTECVEFVKGRVCWWILCSARRCEIGECVFVWSDQVLIVPELIFGGGRLRWSFIESWLRVSLRWVQLWIGWVGFEGWDDELREEIIVKFVRCGKRWFVCFNLLVGLFRMRGDVIGCFYLVLMQGKSLRFISKDGFRCGDSRWLCFFLVIR